MSEIPTTSSDLETTPTSTFEVREATLSDKAELIRLIIWYNQNAEKNLPPFQHQISAYKDLDASAQERSERYLTDPKYFVFVAEENGKLRGYICGSVTDREQRVYEKEGYVENLVVEDSAQSKGVGRQLFDRLEQVFESLDCTHITVDTHIDNPRTIAIYEHLGFTPRLMRLSKPLKDLPEIN